MPHATTVTEFCGLVARSKLVPEAEVNAVHHKWRQETKGTDEDVDAFRKYVVTRRFLTDYQAAVIQRGHADGFYVGDYTILGRIGKGQSAGVYKAVHKSGQVVALKVLPASRAKDPNLLARFQREGRLLTQLDHPNVVRAFHVGQAGSVHYIVMEHLDGETLDEVLGRRKKLPAAEAVRVVWQALSGLQHLFDRRTIHRDLKPANLMVIPAAGPGQADTTLEATVKILDIGIGRELFDEDSPDTKDLQITSEGAILGTPDYLAPEQARDARSADVRSDVYSMGCVLFHLITGRPPFTDKNVMTQMVKHATEKPPALASLVPGVPPGLQGVLDKMTAKKADERYQVPAEAAAALRQYLPDHLAGPAVTDLLPAFKDWLQSESGMDIPAEPRKPATGPAPALATPIVPSGSGTYAPVPARPTAARPAAAQASPAQVPSRPVAQPSPRPVAQAMPLPAEEEEISVELVTLPPPAPVVQAMMPPMEEEERPLSDLNRRDFIMLGAGGGGILVAIGIGFGLAKLMKRATSSDEASDTAAGEKPEPSGK
ncbi:serine/threonine protein kinase [Fimbriiglobus ruber]|uniref:Serine/threonine-protein kinase PknB n=1 Tax=Fimbriiglobus ruber TaxID=1908690 RepID=A0A225DET4_9BACT|nr:serine/threonine-protein kinase [Fimbriiglobus ruber]OWK35846.1 Serine/threonine-protein kinase PknB [Fimbriiglobus ruber]